MDNVARMSEMGRTIHRAFRRFPFLWLFLLATPYFILVSHQILHAKEILVYSVALWLFIGTVLSVFMERLKVSRMVHFGAHALVVVGLGIFSALWWNHTPTPTQGILMLLWLLVAVLMSLNILAFRKGEDPLSFWRQARTFFTRLLLDVICGMVIYGLLALGFLSISTLFRIEINGYAYLDIWILVVGIFGPLFMLGGYPSVTEEEISLLRIEDFLVSVGLYIFLPACILYFGILYAYILSILFTAQWPSGMVTPMVLGFSSLSLITYGLLYEKLHTHPKGILWTRTAFAALIPPVIVLFVAVTMRVQDVALTERRYMLYLAGIWLAGVALYFLFSKKRRLEVIPILLTVLLVLSTFGPWSMVELSRTTQVARLESILRDNNLLQNGKIVRGNLERDSEDVMSILYYLEDHKTLHTLQPLFSEDINGRSANDLIALIDTESTQPNTPLSTRCTLEGVSALGYWNTKGYDYVFENRMFDNHYGANILQQFLNHGGKQYKIANAQKGLIIQISEGSTMLAEINFEEELRKKMQACTATQTYTTLDQEALTFLYENQALRAKVEVISLKADMTADGHMDVSVRLYLSIK